MEPTFAVKTAYTRSLLTDFIVESGEPLLVRGFTISQIAGAGANVTTLVKTGDGATTLFTIRTGAAGVSERTIIMDIPFIASDGLEFSAAGSDLVKNSMAVTVYYSNLGG